MKKLVALSAMALFALSFTSCKKDYTCACTATNVTAVNYPFNDAKKADAKASCDALNTTWKAYSGGSCTLK